MNSKILKNAIFITSVIIVFLAMFFPADRDNVFQGLYLVGDVFSDIRSKRQSSEFPGALVAAYLASIFSGIGLAILGCLSPDIKKLVHLLNKSRGRFGSLFFSFGLITPAIVVMFVDIEPRADNFAGSFFSVVSHNRIALAIWCNAIFIWFFTSFQILFAAVIGLFNSGEKR